MTITRRTMKRSLMKSVAFIQSTYLGKIYLRSFFSATTTCPKVPSSLLYSYLLVTLFVFLRYHADFSPLLCIGGRHV